MTDLVPRPKLPSVYALPRVDGATLLSLQPEIDLVRGLVDAMIADGASTRNIALANASIDPLTRAQERLDQQRLIMRADVLELIETFAAIVERHTGLDLRAQFITELDSYVSAQSAKGHS